MQLFHFVRPLPALILVRAVRISPSAVGAGKAGRLGLELEGGGSEILTAIGPLPWWQIQDFSFNLQNHCLNEA